MTSRWLKLLEVHVEKGALGLAAAFLVAMLYMYLIRSPNKVSYGGRDLGPRDLLVAIKEDADKLDQKVRGADMDDPDPEDFSKRLRKYHAAGIFGAPQAGPTVPRALRLAASFGQEIVVPGLKESEEASGSIVLVRPLKPSPPKLRTGRSLVLRETLQVAGLEGPPSTPPPEESVEADEVAWVTVAAYFNKKAQYNEMIKAGYAPYRSKAYIVGLDVQRKEVLSSGEFSDWQEVVAGKAMPQFELVAPVFDDETGELSNKDEIRQAFGAIKVAQPTLMQPPFYVVEGGDFWEIPPLAGYEDEEEEEEQEEDEAIVVRPGPRPTGRTRTTPTGRTSMGRTRMPGRSEPTGHPGRYTGRAAARTDAEKEREARKEIRKDLAEAKKLLGQKLYDEARSLA
ncbi:MAG: hypothetical protein ACE5KY_06175, partial [Candidatus Tectimicrobiota bacterium]